MVNSTTEWTLRDKNIKKVKVEVEDTECNDIDLFVAQKFTSWEDAMDTCMKLSRTGVDMSDITSLEQFKHWHNTGNMNKVEINLNIVYIILLLYNSEFCMPVSTIVIQCIQCQAR
jgi:hypothetical protein